MRVHNVDQLPANGGQAGHHLFRLRELGLVPREVPLAVRVLNVQPDDVGGDVVVVQVGVDFGHVLLVPVVPPALCQEKKNNQINRC